MSVHTQNQIKEIQPCGPACLVHYFGPKSTSIDGLENAPQIFIGQLEEKNFGKLIILKKAVNRR